MIVIPSCYKDIREYGDITFSEEFHETGATLAMGETIDHLHSFPEEGEGCYWDIDIGSNGIISAHIGNISLARTKHGFWETHSLIFNDLYRGEGFGILLYLLVFQLAERENLEVRSSLACNESASRVWKSSRLLEVYEISEDPKCTYNVYGNSVETGRYILEGRRDEFEEKLKTFDFLGWC